MAIVETVVIQGCIALAIVCVSCGKASGEPLIRARFRRPEQLSPGENVYRRGRENKRCTAPRELPRTEDMNHVRLPDEDDEQALAFTKRGSHDAGSKALPQWVEECLAVPAG